MVAKKMAVKLVEDVRRVIEDIIVIWGHTLLHSQCSGRTYVQLYT